MQLSVNGLRIEAELLPPRDGRRQPRAPVLLIMGLGQQLIAWPDELLDALAHAGHPVVRFDNRDVGLSSQLDHLPMPFLLWQWLKHQLGGAPASPYSLQDMARDALGVLDALRIERAHVVGVSMGGMIAQRLAAGWGSRVLSLASIMSSSGAPRLPGPRADVVRYLLRRPASTAPQDLVAYSEGLVRLIGGSVYGGDFSHVRERAWAAVRRGVHPRGVLRQTLAVLADTERHALLPRIACPTLVIHGTADPLVPLACGQDTARRIPGAVFHAIEGMGHDWPPALMPLWLKLLLPHLRAADPTFS